MPLFLIPLVIEAAPAIIEAGTALVEAVPAIESAIAGAEAAMTGAAATTTAATTAAATTAAETTAAAAATEAAAGATAEAGTSAAARSAASRVMSKEGQEAVMNNVKAHAEEATTKAAAESGFMDKLGAISKWGAVGGVGMKAAGLAAMAGMAAYIHHEVSVDAGGALSKLHETGNEAPSAAKEHAALIDKFAEQSAHYGIATNLSKDTQQIVQQVTMQNAKLDDAIVELNTAMIAAGAVAGMQGMHDQIDTVKLQGESVRQVNDLQPSLLTAPGRLTDEQINKAREVLTHAEGNFSGVASQSLTQAKDMFDHLRPDSDISTTKAALAKYEETRNLMRQEVATNGEVVVSRLQALGDEHAKELHETVQQLMPAIAQANARHVDQQLSQTHEAPVKAVDASAQPARPVQQAHAAPSEADNRPVQAGFKPPVGFAQIAGGEFSR
jgi:hypothetical protein